MAASGGRGAAAAPVCLVRRLDTRPAAGAKPPRAPATHVAVLRRGADRDDASASGGGMKRLAGGSEKDDGKDKGTGPPAPLPRDGRRDYRPAWAVTWRHGGNGSGGSGTGGPKRATAPGTPPVATEGGAAEMEKEEMTKYPGDSGRGHGHSSGGTHRGPAARAPPGASERGAAETAETAGYLGDGGGGGAQDGSGSGTAGYVMGDGQDGTGQ